MRELFLIFLLSSSMTPVLAQSKDMGVEAANAAQEDSSTNSEADKGIAEARALFGQEKFEEARKHFRVALDLRRSTLGEDNLDTAISYAELAISLSRLGR